jgi:hypothetical protein
LKAKERQTIRLRDAQAGKPVAKTKRITIEDVDGYTDEERRHFENPMSILEGLEGLGDFKSKMQQLMLNLAEKRAQGRPVSFLAGLARVLRPTFCSNDFVCFPWSRNVCGMVSGFCVGENVRGVACHLTLFRR